MKTNDALRIGDAERDTAIATLTRHFTDGRLTQSEHEERIGQALQARTGTDLRLLFADLPRFDDPPPPVRSRRGGPGFHWIVQPMLSGLIVLTGILLILQLVPVLVLVAMAFVASRLFFGCRRGWYAGAARGSWRRDGIFYRR
jgi:hypothetical protein